MFDHSPHSPILAYLLAGTVVFFAASCSSSGPQNDLERNKRLVVETFAVLDAGALDDLDKYIAADYVRHCQATPEAIVSSLDDFKALLREWAGIYSDVKTKVDVLVAAGDLVPTLNFDDWTQKLRREADRPDGLRVHSIEGKSATESFRGTPVIDPDGFPVESRIELKMGAFVFRLIEE